MMSRIFWTRLIFIATSILLILCPKYLFDNKVACGIAQGLFFGYFNASIAESVIHNLFGHAPKWLRKVYKKYPRMLRWTKWIYESHTEIHHAKTFKKDFVTQFETCHKETELLESLAPWQRVHVKLTRFGLTIGLESFPYFMGPPTLIGLPIIYFMFGTIATITAFIVLFIPPLASMCMHPFIHTPYEKALSNTTFFTRTLLKSKFYRSIIRRHWIHHKYPRYNFNLVPGGDELQGVYKEPNDIDLKQMAEQGIPLN